MALSSEEAIILNEESKVIAKILQNLDGDELKEARFVSSTFDQIIMSHSDLFWRKNVMRVQIQTSYACKKSKKEWSLLKLHRLVSHYGCPNFRFNESNLMSLGSTEFFQSSVRYTIKHLQLIKCFMTSDMLLHIVACCSKSLEHFEVRDFSKMMKAVQPSLFPEGKKPPSLPNLQTLILDNTGGSEETIDAMTPTILHHLLRGTKQLKQVVFTGWSAKSCRYFLQIFGSLFVDYQNEMRKLEILCLTEDNSPIFKQYSFIKHLGSLYMPKLQKLSLQFDRPVEPSQEFTGDLLGDLCEGIGNVIEDSSKNIEVVELINCPVTSAVFRKGSNPKAYPSLWRVTTRGCLIPNLDEDANPFHEYNSKSRSSLQSAFRRRTRTGRESSSQLSRGSTVLADNDDEMTMQASEDGQMRQENYKIVCITLLVIGLVHVALSSLFPTHIANSLEIFIHSSIAIFAVKHDMIRKVWLDLQKDDERTSTEDT